ncbi:hypothetical protein HD554DRAFT_2167284 [Boletus coccyginus]|nr:hypothetical protein HD554DRAFT_2167284 [Boletus coccyginus]
MHNLFLSLVQFHFKDLIIIDKPANQEHCKGNTTSTKPINQKELEGARMLLKLGASASSLNHLNLPILKKLLEECGKADALDPTKKRVMKMDVIQILLARPLTVTESYPMDIDHVDSKDLTNNDGLDGEGLDDLLGDEIMEDFRAKELAPFHNKGWPFLKKMEQFCPSGTIATGTFSIAPMEVVSVDDSASDNLDDGALEFEPLGLPMNNFEFSSNISMKSLLQLGHNLSSPDPSIQFSALNSTISMYSQVSPAALNDMRSLYDHGTSPSPALHSFSPSFPQAPPSFFLMSLDPGQSYSLTDGTSNQTLSDPLGSSHVLSRIHTSSSSSLIASSGIKKAKSRVRTPAISTRSSFLSSKAASRQSAKATQGGSGLSTSLAIHGIAGAILCVGDNFNCGLECIVTSTTTPSQAEQSISPGPQASNTQEIRCLAMSMVKTDNCLTVAIRGKLVSAFLSDIPLALSYIKLADASDI